MCHGVVFNESGFVEVNHDDALLVFEIFTELINDETQCQLRRNGLETRSEVLSVLLWPFRPLYSVTNTHRGWLRREMNWPSFLM